MGRSPRPGPRTRVRWSGDQRGAGSSGGPMAGEALKELLADMRQHGWAAEEPVTHLGPKLEAWVASQAQARWTIDELSQDETQLLITARWSRPSGRMRDLRADAHALIGAMAESSTHVRQRVVDGAVSYEVVTGEPRGHFAPHGHLVVLRVTGQDALAAAAGTGDA